MACEAVAESVGREIASAESAAPSEIVTPPAACTAMPNGMGPKLMRSGEMAQTSPAAGMAAGKVSNTSKMPTEPPEMPPTAEVPEVPTAEVPEVPATEVPATKVPTTKVPTTEVATTEVAPSPTEMPATSAVPSAKGHNIVRKRNRH